MNSVIKLHLNKRAQSLGVPVMILSLVVIISILIAVTVSRFGVDIKSEEFVEGFKYNSGVLWSLPGFLGYLGVQAVSTTFPFGMALGTTRREYSLGTLGFYILLSAYIGLIGVALLGLELLTNHWFIGAYALDVFFLGGGNPAITFVTLFILSLTVLTIGGSFASVYLKAGPKGPLLVGVGLILVVLLILVMISPWLANNFASINRWHIIGLGAVIATIAMFGEHFALKSANVR